MDILIQKEISKMFKLNHNISHLAVISNNNKITVGEH